MSSKAALGPLIKLILVFAPRRDGELQGALWTVNEAGFAAFAHAVRLGDEVMDARALGCRRRGLPKLDRVAIQDGSSSAVKDAAQMVRALQDGQVGDGELHGG